MVNANLESLLSARRAFFGRPGRACDTYRWRSTGRNRLAAADTGRKLSTDELWKKVGHCDEELIDEDKLVRHVPRTTIMMDFHAQGGGLNYT
jgi:hypothetical protein